MPSEVATVAYELRLLALVDVLGWKNLIARSESDPEAQALVAKAVARVEATMGLQRASEWGAQYGAKYDVGGAFSHFSDTFAFSTAARAGAAPFFTMGVADVCCDLLDLGLCPRGALVVGKLVHKPGAIYGPALVEADQIEKCIADVPRVVVTPAASALLSPVAWFHTDPRDNREYLDVLRGRVLNSPASLDNMLSLVRQNLAKAQGNARVEPKYKWLEAYVLQAIEETKAPPPPPLNLDPS
jgi:hypothetical protein